MTGTASMLFRYRRIFPFPPPRGIVFRPSHRRGPSRPSQHNHPPRGAHRERSSSSSHPFSSRRDRLPPPPATGIPFDDLPWNLNLPTEHSYVRLVTTPEVGWTNEHYDPHDDTGMLLSEGDSTTLHRYSDTPLPLYPSNTSLNYGTTIWEGLACRRSPTSGRALLFRPDMNYRRLANGANAMCLPVPSYELFMRGLQVTLQANGSLIPPPPAIDEDTGLSHSGGAKLYVRPMLLGSGQQLGLHPSPEISLLYYVSPTGSYFKGKVMGGLKLHLERNRSRASRGGMGNVKCCGNYAVTMRPLMDAKKMGFDDNLYLELDTYHNPPRADTSSTTSSRLHGAILQELSAANVFLVLNTGEIVTPSLKRGTILPGVTRDSVLTLAREYTEELRPIVVDSIRLSGMGSKAGTNVDDVKLIISERDVRVSDLLDAVEVFITGTAAEVVPVQSVGTSPTPRGELDGDDDANEEEEESLYVKFPHGESSAGPVTTKLLHMMREVLAEQRSSDATKNWLCDVYSSPDDFRRGGLQ